MSEYGFLRKPGVPELLFRLFTYEEKALAHHLSEMTVRELRQVGNLIANIRKIPESELPNLPTLIGRIPEQDPGFVLRVQDPQGRLQKVLDTVNNEFIRRRKGKRSRRRYYRKGGRSRTRQGRGRTPSRRRTPRRRRK